MCIESFKSLHIGSIDTPGSHDDTIDIEVISSTIFTGEKVNHAVSALLVYREPLYLSSESLEYAALVITSIKENEDGSIVVDPLALAATSMSHVSQLSGLLEWVRL
jgi:hypothetical protein